MTAVSTVTQVSTVNVTDEATSQAPGPPHYVDELKLANRVILSTILAFIMVAMGCVISIKDIKTTVSVHLLIFFVLFAIYYFVLKLRQTIYSFTYLLPDCRRHIRRLATAVHPSHGNTSVYHVFVLFCLVLFVWPW